MNTAVESSVELSRVDRERGYAECYEILREHGKTFYVMARLLGPDRGRAIAAIYGFARTADDTVDESESGVPLNHIRARIETMRSELGRALAQKSADARFAVLGETMRKYEIERYPFDDLLEGVLMDLSVARYSSFDELALYCYRVAGTIGLMITPVAGFQRRSNAMEHAKTLGTAFQLTNILRDVGEDLGRGRIYLPEQELARFGVSEQTLLERQVTPGFQELMEFQIERAFRLYRDGLQLIPLVTTWGGRIAFQFAVDAYSEILNKIRDNGYDVFTRRAHLTFWEKIWMVPKSVWRALRASIRA